MNSQEKAGLMKNTAKGIGYLSIATVVANLIRILSLALLARKLTAADFGVASLAIVFSRFGQESAAFGLETTIVQKKILSDEYTNNCFWGGLLFASALCGGYVVCSPLISGIMRMPDLAPALKLACTVILVTCLGMVPRSLMERRLAYGKVAGIEVCGQGLGDISSVIFAFAGLGLWSIVAGFVAGETIKTIGFWVATRWHPNLRNVRIRNLKFWQFGSFVTADRILTYFSLNLDRMIIGRVLGAAAAGYYVTGIRDDRIPGQAVFSACGKSALLVPEPDPGPVGNRIGYLLEDDPVCFDIDRPGNRRSRRTRSGGIPDYLWPNGRCHRPAPSTPVSCRSRVCHPHPDRFLALQSGEAGPFRQVESPDAGSCFSRGESGFDRGIVSGQRLP